MEKHQKHHLLLSFFFHMIGTKKYMPMRDNNFFIPHVKKGTLFNVFNQQHKQSKNMKIKTTLEKVWRKERYERRERERERDTQEGKATNFVAKVCSLQNFWSRVYFLTTQIHKKLWALELFWGCWVGILRRDWRRRGKGAQIRSLCLE